MWNWSVVEFFKFTGNKLFWRHKYSDTCWLPKFENRFFLAVLFASLAFSLSLPPFFWCVCVSLSLSLSLCLSLPLSFPLSLHLSLFFHFRAFISYNLFFNISLSSSSFSFSRLCLFHYFLALSQPSFSSYFSINSYSSVFVSYFFVSPALSHTLSHSFPLFLLVPN